MSNLERRIALQVCLGSYAFAILMNADDKQERDSQHRTGNRSVFCQ